MENNVNVHAAEAPQHNKPKRKWRRTGLIALVVVTVASVSTAAFLYKKNQDLLANPSAVTTKRNAEDTKRVLEKLSSLMHIDEKEKPTVARVTKPELLQKNNKTFYKDVKAGDYLILYPKRAIIYRESENKVINVAPIINANQIKAKESPTPSPSQSSRNR